MQASKVLATVVVLSTSSCVIDELRVDDVGDAPACEAVAAWQHGWGEREDSLFLAINRLRAEGTMCGERTRDPVPDLEVAPALRCAARIHAVDLSEQGALSHDGRDGSTTLSRVDLARYVGVPTHEVLAADYLDPQTVVDAWQASPDNCEALMSSTATELGAGFARDDGDVRWVVLVGESRR